jgi:hypothetical protein
VASASGNQRRAQEQPTAQPQAPPVSRWLQPPATNAARKNNRPHNRKRHPWAGDISLYHQSAKKISLEG